MKSSNSKTIVSGSLIGLLLSSFVVVIGGSNIALAEESAPDVSTASGSNRFVVWRDTTGQGDIYLRRSTDNGATWKAAVNLSNNAGTSLNPKIAVSGANVFVAWDQYNADATLRDIILKRSTDNGATWKSSAKITPGGTCTVSDGACPFLSTLVASGSSVYMISEKAGDVFLRRSADNAVTWKAPVNLSSNSGNSFDPDIALSGSNIYVTWSQANSANTSFDIFIRRSTDSGATWKSKVNLSNDAFFSQLGRVAASGSNVYVIWGDVPWDGPGSSDDISLRRSIDAGATWEPRQVISETAPNYPDESGNRNGAYEAQIIAVGSNVYIAYKDNVIQGDKDASTDIFFRKSTDGGAFWAPSVKVGHADNNDNPDECIPFKMAVSGTNAFMVWAGTAACGSELGISFSRSTDGGASWSAPVVLTEDVFVKGALPSTTLEMAASGSTVLLVVTRVMSGPGSEIFVGRSTDSGQNWPLAANLSKMSGLSLSPQIGL